MRELEETLDQYEFILFNLSNCSIFCPDKLPEIYKELFERKKNGSLYQFFPPKPTGDLHDEEDEKWDSNKDWDDEPENESAEAIFEEIFGSDDKESEFEDEYSFGINDKQHRKLISASEESRLKKCYRMLAKKLHPDHSTFDESLREKRWHEVQEAYRNNDLNALLRVEAICDLDETNLSVKMGLARLNDLANYHQSHLKPIRSALSHAKRDIAFGFAKSGPTREIENEIKYEFDFKLNHLESHITYMQQSADDILQEYLEELEPVEISAASYDSKVKSKPKVNEDPRQMNLF
jgi:hypothetical protein